MFIERPLKKISGKCGLPVSKVGVNDASYAVSYIEDGKILACPFYVKWKSMIERCYSVTPKKIFASYADCTVCDEWLNFSVFRAWMEQQDWKGKDLDKDILVQGNKVYGPDGCLFVERRINNLMAGVKSKKGSLKVGVCFHKGRNKYQANCSKGDGTSSYLGIFNTEELAFDAYKKFKYKLIADIAKNQDEPLKSALLNYEIN